MVNTLKPYLKASDRRNWKHESVYILQVPLSMNIIFQTDTVWENSLFLLSFYHAPTSLFFVFQFMPCAVVRVHIEEKNTIVPALQLFYQQAVEATKLT